MAALGWRGKWASREGAELEPARESGQIQGESGLTARIRGTMGSLGLLRTRGHPPLSPCHSGSCGIGGLSSGGVHFALARLFSFSFYRSGLLLRGKQIAEARPKVDWN